MEVRQKDTCVSLDSGINSLPIDKPSLKSDKITQIAKDLITLTKTSSNKTLSSIIETSTYSHIEAAILSAHNPFEINETEMITINGEQGLWSNKSEIQNWKGPIPISDYMINDDPSPEVIRKKPELQLKYEQEVAVRYLRPPTPPSPGEIIIKMEKNIPTPPGPPLIIRQQPPRTITPPPLIIREAPPKPPSRIEQKIITIPGKRLPPPPRKVIIERLAPIPSKPQPIIVERWLPYKDQKRRVIFTKSNEPDPIIEKPKNIIIQWEQPDISIKKDFKDLGILRANPNEYIEKYNDEVKPFHELPDFVREIRPPKGISLAAEYQLPPVIELVGDIDALKLLDLDKEGLSEYKYLISKSDVKEINKNDEIKQDRLKHISNIDQLIAEVFTRLDKNSNGRISRHEAENILMVLNSQLGRRHGDKETKEFFGKLEKPAQKDNSVDFEEFKKAMFELF